MKIYFGADIREMKYYLKFCKSNGDFMFSVEENCNDHTPFRGFELNEDEKSKIKEAIYGDLNE